MNRLVNWLDKHLVPIAAKLGAQKHLVAIRDAFAGTMPVMLAGAMAVMLNNVIFGNWGLLAQYTYANGMWLEFFEFSGTYITPIMGSIWNGSLAILSLMFVIGLAYHRANQEKMDAVGNIVIVTGTLIVMGFMKFFDASGIFVSMLLALIVSEIHFFVVRKKWTIKMPDSVPPAVSKSFTAVIPGIICLTLGAIITFSFSFIMIGEEPATIYSWFATNIQTILNGFGESIVTIVLMSFLTPLFWFFGLHGHQMLTPLYDGIYLPMGIENMENFMEGITTIEQGLYPWVRGSWDVYVQMGGSGSTLCLLIAIFLVGKVASEREIAKLALPMGVFQINEPVSFGIPIVLNVTYAIPFILVPVIQTLIAYYATVAGFAGPVVNTIAWTTPPIFGAFLATNGSIGALIIAIINFVLAIIIYLPFVLMSNQMNQKEN